MHIKQTELWVGSTAHLKIYERHPDFEVLDPASVAAPCDHAVRFTSLTITPAIYLARLVIRIRALGGSMHRAHVPSLSALASPPLVTLYGQIPRAIFVCAGLGAATLGGVSDSTVYPTRGQVVLVQAPWVRSGVTRQVGSLDGGEGGSRTYVIPRVNGEVVLGGTREVDDWEAKPRGDTARDILRRVREIAPEVVPGTAGRGDADGLEGIFIAHLVGLRPSRTGGIRLEREDLRIAGEQVTVIHNYGHGGAGWQSSWGTAESAVAFLQPPGPGPARL
jgi:glycine/D-amino acid oxidase-like deaminating enzyme